MTGLKLRELFEMKFPERPEQVGAARYKKTNNTILVDAGGYDYEIDLDRGNLEFWLEHIHKKTWSNEYVLGSIAEVYFNHRSNMKNN